MKTVVALILLVLSITLLQAQSDRIKNLEKVLSQQSGEDYLRNALTLSEWYFTEGFFEKSADRADDAYRAAKKLNLNNYMALALNQRGKALVKTPNKRNSLKNKAFKCFEESNGLTTDAVLRMDNLQYMKDLAMLLDKRKDLNKILNDIAVLSGENPDNRAGEDLSGNRRQILEKAQEIQQENQELSQTVSSLSQEKEKLRKQQKNLEQLVSQKEAAIQDMTAEQMRQELMLSEQERILDSMAFSSILDSMEISQKDMIVLQQKAELERADAEIRLQKSQRNLLLALAGLGLLLAAGLFHRYYAIRQHNAVLAEKNHIIEEERKRSEELLLNILPVAVAAELKAKGSAEAKHYDKATVLFADFKGFSQISRQLPPEKLVADLDFAFTNFDKIISKNGLEKSKPSATPICVPEGCPAEITPIRYTSFRRRSKYRSFSVGGTMKKQSVASRCLKPESAYIPVRSWQGLVGSKKFAYDIWGDTVNVAARMESSSEAGRVNISDATFKLVKDQFRCEFRGKVPAKNVGEVEMYFVEDH